MPLFEKKTYTTEEQKHLSVVTFWLFVVAVFAWVIPFTLIFVLKLMETAGNTGAAMAGALWPSIITFLVAAVLCILAYFVYRKLILKI